MTKENLYIPSNRATNRQFREGWDRTFGDYPEERRGIEDERLLRKKPDRQYDHAS